MRDTQRGSQSYMKKRRGRREREMSRRRKMGTQEEREIYAVVCSQSVLLKKRRGRREREMSRRRKMGTQEEREIYAVVCSQSVLCSPDTHKDSQNRIGKRRGKEKIEVF